MRTLFIILAFIPCIAGAQKFSKDSAAVYISRYMANNTRPVQGFVLNEALSLILQSVTDSIYSRNDSLLRLYNGIETTVQPSKKRSFSDSLDFPNVTTGNYHDTTVSLTGALDSDPVTLGVPAAAVLNGVAYFAWISSTGQATIRFYNFSGSDKNPPKALFKLTGLKQ